MKLQQQTLLFIMPVMAAVFSQTLHAGAVGAENKVTPPYPTFITLNLGPGWPTSTQNEVIELLPNVSNRYISSDDTDAFIDGELFVGWQKKTNDFTHLAESQFGVAYMTTNSAKIHGIIWQANDPRFDNETYAYRIKHSHVALRGKLLSTAKKSFQGYLTGSVGVGFNTSYAFDNYPVISTVLRSPNFQTNTQTAFTWNAAAGIQKLLNSNWAIGMGYQFADWGKSQLSRAPGQTLNTGPSFNRFYTSEAQFNLTYSVA